MIRCMACKPLHLASLGQSDLVGMTSRSRCAAISGVMSRCALPSSSNPTMNLRTVAERNRGG